MPISSGLVALVLSPWRLPQDDSSREGSRMEATRDSTGLPVNRAYVADLLEPPRMNRRGPANAVRRLPSCAIPAHDFGSGWLNPIGGIGPHAIPIEIAKPIKAAIAAGEPVLCWIDGQPIVLEWPHPNGLTFDHVIPWSYGGATDAANLLPAGSLANCQKGNKLDILRERGVGWKWGRDAQGNLARFPDYSQRLVRVVTPEGEAVFWSVPKFQVGEFAIGVGAATGLAVVISVGIQRATTGEIHVGDLGVEAGKAAAGYAARYSAKIAVKQLAPKTIALGVDAAGVKLVGHLAGPVGFAAAVYAVEAVEQGVALARGETTAIKAAKEFALAPVGFAKDTGDLAVAGYKLVSPRHRAIRETQRKWRSINFVPDLCRSDPSEVPALAV